MSDPQYMAEALAMARRAEGRTRPNPLVGCVIVKDGEVVASGYHHRAGEPHGEVDALSQLAPGAARGGDLYVNLEPCCTHGRTPPCTEAILAAGIRRVIVGTIDTNPKVCGTGVETLRNAGLEVTVGVLGDESRELNAPYFKTMEKGLPWVAAKWAMSLDGKIATREGDSCWISGEPAREYAHRLRDRLDAVLVGTKTLLTDDPRLTCRVEGGRDPIRVVLDSALRAGPDRRVYDTPGTLVFAGPDAAAERVRRLQERGAIVVQQPLDERGRFHLEAALRALLAHDVMSVLVEGGGELLGSMFDANLIDRVYAFVSPVLIGGREATPAVGGVGVAAMEAARRLTRTRIEQVGDDLLVIGDTQ